MGDMKLMKAMLKAFPLKEMKKPEREFVESLPAAKKKFESPITYSEQLELDSRRWNEKSLTEALGRVARFEMQILATRVYQINQDTQKGKIAKPEKELIAAYDRIEKMVIEKVANAIAELKSDSGDNKKALKDGKVAFQDIDKIDWKSLFAEPRKAVATELVKLMKSLRAIGDDPPARDDETPEQSKERDRVKQVRDKERFKAMDAASKPVGQAGATFARRLQEAASAGDVLLNMAKETGKSEDVAPELADFARQLLRGKKLFETIADEGKEVTELVGDVEKGLKDRSANPDQVGRWLAINAKLGDGDKAASAAGSWIKKMKPQFLAIAKKLA